MNLYGFFQTHYAILVAVNTLCVRALPEAVNPFIFPTIDIVPVVENGITAVPDNIIGPDTDVIAPTFATIGIL